MLFRRKIPLNWWQSLRGWLWPRSGWSRALKYIWRRLTRLSDSPHGVAAGLASGIAVSFTPFIGLHLALGWALAWIVRGNWIAAALGTLVGNPWTFPFIWLITYRTGAWMLGREPTQAEPIRLAFDLVMSDPLAALGPLVLPTCLGSLPFLLVSWWLAYWPSRRMFERYQTARRDRLEKIRRRLGARRPGATGVDGGAEFGSM